MEPSPEQGKVGITNPSIQCWGMSRGLQIPSDRARAFLRNLRNLRETRNLWEVYALHYGL